MDITGLNIMQIQKKIYPYVAHYFKRCKVSSFKEWAFDSFIFDFEEIIHLIPSKHHHRFKDGARFSGASGFLELDSTTAEYQDKKYILMLISDENNKTAYFLYVQELSNNYDKQRDILIKNFME